MPNMGANGRIRPTNRGANLSRLSPKTSGINTSDATDFSTAIPFTTTTQFNNHWIRMGVAKTPNNVVVKVHTMDRATSPPAKSVNKLDACPPLTEPSNTIPAVWWGVNPNACEIVKARRGIIPKQRRAFAIRIEGVWPSDRNRVRDKSLDVMVSPMDHMRVPSAHCIVESDPRVILPVVEPRDDFDDRPTHAAPTVHRGAYLVNRPDNATTNDDDDIVSSSR
mmetsp:Transcript_6101/g.10832  ORF Transcript_6101/g.10832 Transcript_6101/m.10832 type:complete len:222 (-) Transcript_6101:237-902(-)